MLMTHRDEPLEARLELVKHLGCHLLGKVLGEGLAAPVLLLLVHVVQQDLHAADQLALGTVEGPAPAATQLNLGKFEAEGMARGGH
jgi:hypothetical protein